MLLKDSPALLLLLTGGFLGLTFPLGKLAGEAMISPVVWAWLIAAGSGSVMLLIHVLSGNKMSLRTNFIKYYFALSVCALVIPNILIFVVIPKLGSGFTGILFTLSPICTLVLSSIWKVRTPTWLGALGIAIGLLGAVMVALTRGEINQPASFVWILTGLCIPISLAIGNLYRTVAWPEGATPFELATGSNLAAAIQLFIILLAFSEVSEISDLLQVKKLALMQVVGSVIMFSMFFRLQQIGGPTYLSQIGYVAAGVALLTGTVFLGERYSFLTWMGAAVIVIGIGFGVVAQRQRDA